MNSIKWPEISQKKLEKINSCFTAYLFYENLPNGKREVTCTRCGQKYTVSYNKGSSEYYIMNASHNEQCIKCANCGTVGTAKSIGKSKTRKNLYEEQRICFITKKSYNKVIIQCYECVKHYDFSTNPIPHYEEVSRYILTPGNARKFSCSYWHNNWDESSMVREPFHPKSCIYWVNNYPDNSYVLFGYEKLADTFLKYNMMEDYIRYARNNSGNRYSYFDKFVSYLCRFSEYPQIEMLQKLGHYDFIYDLVENNKKNRCNYNKGNPAEFFRISKEEYKILNRYKNNGKEILDMFKIAKRYLVKEPFTKAVTACMEYRLSLYHFDKLLEFVRNESISYDAEIKYLKKHNILKDNIYRTYIYHKDYIDIASELGYDLTVHNVFFPKNLKEAHDLAVETVTQIHEQKRIKEQKELEAKAKKYLKARDKQYEFTMDGYTIIVPHTADEIILEGKAMHHCVGGYAGRHLEGKLTICFLRLNSEINKSLYTIEMHDKRLQQVRGYENRTPLTESAKAFFDLWLEWVESGSHRDKEGNPIIKNLIKKGA